MAPPTNNNGNNRGRLRGYADVNAPNENEDTSSTSFQDAISTLSSMLQQEARPSHSRGSQTSSSRGAHPNPSTPNNQRGYQQRQQQQQQQTQPVHRGETSGHYGPRRPSPRGQGNNSNSNQALLERQPISISSQAVLGRPSPRGHDLPNQGLIAQQFRKNSANRQLNVSHNFPSSSGHYGPSRQSPPRQPANNASNQILLQPMPNGTPPNQSSESHPFTHYCTICNLWCNHEIAYKQHLSGKKHKKNATNATQRILGGGHVGGSRQMTPPVASLPHMNPMPTQGLMNVATQAHMPLGNQMPHPPTVVSGRGAKPKNGNTLIKNEVTGGSNSANQADNTHEQYHCSVCNVTCNHELAYKQHLDGKRHKKQVARFGGGNMIPSLPLQQLISAPSALTSPAVAVAGGGAAAGGAAVTTPSEPTSSAPSTEPQPAGVDGNDSEEEGEIDEEKEDIEHLYNEFAEPVSSEVSQAPMGGVTGSSIQVNNDSDVDEMFGEDDDGESGNKVGTNTVSDIGKMFGGDEVVPMETSGVVIAAAAQNLTSSGIDADDHEMFGESSDEEGKISDQAPNFTPTKPMTMALSKENKNVNKKVEFAVNSNQNQSNVDISTSGSKDVDEKPTKRKRVSFCTQPTVTETTPAPSVPMTASEALAAARRRTSIPKVQIKQATQNLKSLLKTSPRPSFTSAQVQNNLKSLLKKTSPSSTTTTTIQRQADEGIPKRSYYSPVHPDKFWSTMRAWDFVRDFNDAMKTGKQPAKNEDGDVSKGGKKRPFDEMKGEKSLPLPDKFDSVSQYRALWAPLLIEEAKAQLLSEVVSAQSSPSTAWMNRARLVWGVVAKLELSRSGKDLSGTSMEATVVLQLRPTQRGAGIGCQVLPNDLLLCVREATIVELALRGKALSEIDDCSTNSILGVGKGRLGFVAHALNHRSRTIDGLQIRASQRLWNQFSSLDEMFVIRIGANVTALREFNALSRLEEIPLSKYLLNGQTDSAGGDESNDASSKPGSTYDPLSQSGLPIGFRIYVKSKMNQSQLQAITASAREYGCGGFTLIKGPPGTGKSTTLVSVLNALHLRQYQEYYKSIERIVTESGATNYEELAMLNKANEAKPRILVCAPSNAATDNVVVKIMQDLFVDGDGTKYSPSIVRVGSGVVNDVAKKVSLQAIADSIIQQGTDTTQLQMYIENGRKKLSKLLREIQKLKVRIQAIVDACPYEICEDWEIRILEDAARDTFKILFVNHKTKTTTFDIPPKVRPFEKVCSIKSLPHYVSMLKSFTEYVERHNNESSSVEKFIVLQNHSNAKRECLQQELETNIINSAHIVLTTLGSAGSRAVESANKFEVIVIDEAAQSSEMNTLLALQLGSSHAILVGDPQQLPATIFSMSGRSNKYDRSLFQRLEQCGHPVVMLNTQYRMNPMISEFPRHIFYKGMLLDGPNTHMSDFGGNLKLQITKSFPHFKPVTVFDLDSIEKRDGTGLSNMHEAQLTLHLYISLDRNTKGLLENNRVAIITPYAQQTLLLHRLFEDAFGSSYSQRVEISTVDAFQGREAGIVLYSCVRAGGKGSGIGFLSDVQRMNVALTRAQHYLFIIARRRSIMVNHYWGKLIGFARERRSLIHVPMIHNKEGPKSKFSFPELAHLAPVIRAEGGCLSESDVSA